MSNSANESYNSHQSSNLNPTERKILEAIKNSRYPITPKEIAGKTGINHNTVRVIVRKLDRLGFVRKPFYGHYEAVEKSLTLEGVGGGGFVGEGVRLHRVLLVVRGVGGFGVGRRVVLDGDWFSVKFVGFSSGVVNVYVNCRDKYSFDYPAFRLLVEFVRAKLGVSEDTVIVVPSYELNVDYRGIQLDGVKALTLKAFDESFERLYNKDKNTLRSEIHLSKGAMVPERAYVLMKGGVVPYNIFQSVYALIQEIRKEREVWKFIARHVIERGKKKYGENNARGGSS